MRVIGGPGAGEVHRLAIGSFSLGSSARAGIVLQDSLLPEIVGYVEVSGSGEVTVRPASEAVALHGMPRPRDRDAGPIVLPDETGEEQSTTVVEPDTVPALVELERRPLDDEATWRPGAVLTVGSVLLSLEYIEPPDASLSPSPDGVTLDFNRPPRLLPPDRTTEFRLPAEPRKPQRQAFPLAMMSLPLVGSVAMALILDRWFYLIFGLLSPLMYLGQYLSGRRTGKETHRD